MLNSTLVYIRNNSIKSVGIMYTLHRRYLGGHEGAVAPPGKILRRQTNHFAPSLV